MKTISIERISSTYHVRKLNENDIEGIYELSIENPQYFHYCPPMVTMQSIVEDMSVLPPNVTVQDKHYIGFYEGDSLVAIMDLISNYPNEQTAFIGLFMVSLKYQHKGVGSHIIQELKEYLKNAGFDYMRLAFAKGNSQSSNFWVKNGFAPTGEEVDLGLYSAIPMQCEIKRTIDPVVIWIDQI